MTDSYFREGRNVELSTIYYIETSINSDWTNMTVVKRFTDAYKAALPVIAISMFDTVNTRQEIGNTALSNTYVIAIDIFAKSDGQRIDIADYLINQLKDCWTYYTHSQTPGSPETLTRTPTDKLHVEKFVSNRKVDLGDEGVDVYDRFRGYIEIEVSLL